MAHKKGTTCSKNGRDSISKRLGIKKINGQFIQAGQIILRQHGLEVKPGFNVKKGLNFSLFAEKTGYLYFTKLYVNNSLIINIKNYN